MPMPASARWWQWPTVLSLDAPLVAVAWQRLLAAPGHVHLEAAPSWVLGLSVWLAYVADRWIEGWRLTPERIRTQRHHFYQQWRWQVAGLWLAALVADLAVAFHALAPRELGAGLFILAPVLVYVFVHQLLDRHRPDRLPKEAWIACLLGGGVAVFIVAAPASSGAVLALPLALFVLLAFANCVLISIWEQPVDVSHGQTSLALQYARAMPLLRALPLGIALLAGASWPWLGPAAHPALLCAIGSALALLWIDRREARLGRRLARVLADVALLTPFAALLWP